MVPGKISEQSQAKGLAAAYGFWAVLGFVGAHRFYLGRTGSGFAQAASFVLGVPLAIFGTAEMEPLLLVPGVLLLIFLISWMTVDFFLMPSLHRRASASIIGRHL